ncbi:integrator complex subunit 14 [Condylostylus longicornis]|uniref:integrator complex subunit 14 n=1 Tax=Condylostylus longicornis TaxID=2530218 RepID=UPI00244DE59C|nr:integrator complex subunit 14 [Condylostylus longicornis]
MPTVIALDISLSMTCTVSETDETTYHKLAVQGIKEFLNYLSTNCKLEFVALATFSSTCEIVVDFTRDYESIRQALKKIEHIDKVNYEDLLQTASNALATNWGTQCLCQVIIFTDCGLGFGNTSLKNIINNIATKTIDIAYPYMKYLQPNRVNFVCIGCTKNTYFAYATQIYQQFLTVSGIKGHCYKIKTSENSAKEGSNELNRNSISEMIERVCEANYKPFEAVLKCGGYFRLESPIILWPAPTSYKPPTKQTSIRISRRIELCGFIGVSDVGSPVSLSRHLILPKHEHNDRTKKDKKESSNEFEKLENEIRAFYSKGDGNNSEEEEPKHSQSESYKENVVVLLHGALKVDNKAALVLLNDNWYGFIYSYADTKKKCNLMLSILPPGNKVVPWLGDFRLLGMSDDILPGENPSFPVKSEKRSYSQNIVVWIKTSALNSDLQKVLRHAKKLPEKTPHFYKELNRIRRAALSLGFIELLDTLAIIFEKEISNLPQNASPDCALQFRHAAEQLRKNRDFKGSITALPTKYNQLQ